MLRTLCIDTADVGGKAIVELLREIGTRVKALDARAVIALACDGVARREIKPIAVDWDRIMRSGDAVLPMVTVNAAAIPAPILGVEAISDRGVSKPFSIA